jgi:hypothetical protein
LICTLVAKASLDPGASTGKGDGAAFAAGFGAAAAAAGGAAAGAAAAGFEAAGPAAADPEAARIILSSFAIACSRAIALLGLAEKLLSRKEVICVLEMIF